MMMRIFLAGLLGALAMFIWSFVAHMLTPLGEFGISEIPNESAVTSTLVSNLGQTRGFYYFPGTGLGPSASHAERAAAMQKMADEFESKPSGVIIYRPPGFPFVFGKLLVREFVLEFVESLLAAFLLAQTRLFSFAKRVGFVAIIGVIAAITTNMSYWNWYGFPKEYTAGYMLTQMIGYLCAGLVIAFIVKHVPRTAEMA